MRVIPQKEILGTDTDKHGIGMDAYIEDISEEDEIASMYRNSKSKPVDVGLKPDIYDIEPNKINEKGRLPKWFIP